MENNYYIRQYKSKIEIRCFNKYTQSGRRLSAQLLQFAHTVWKHTVKVQIQQTLHTLSTTLFQFSCVCTGQT